MAEECVKRLHVVEAALRALSGSIASAYEYAVVYGVEPPRVPWGGTSVDEFEVVGSYEDDARYIYPAREELRSRVAEHALKLLREELGK